MYKKIDPFISTLPQLDVHGEIRDTVMTVVNAFINEQYHLGKEKVLIIHGKGADILRKEIFDKLKYNKQVKKYNLYNMNLGCTIVELNKKEG